jgi:hypothetical protein
MVGEATRATRLEGVVAPCIDLHCWILRFDVCRSDSNNIPRVGPALHAGGAATRTYVPAVTIIPHPNGDRWSVLPFVTKQPKEFSAWYYASQYLKPSHLAMLLYVLINRMMWSAQRFQRRQGQNLRHISTRAYQRSIDFTHTVGQRRTVTQLVMEQRVTGSLQSMSATDEKHLGGYSDIVYSARQQTAVAFIQAFRRTHSLESAVRARSKSMEQAREGIQFAQRHVICVEGDRHCSIGLVRGKTCKSDHVRVAVSAVDGSAHLGDDYEVYNELIEFPAGERFAVMQIGLPENGVSFSEGRSWEPVRDMFLLITPVNAAGKPDASLQGSLGDARVCRVQIIDHDKWPETPAPTGWTPHRLFMAYVRHIFFQNFVMESWWYFGVLIRTVSTKIVKNLLTIILWDLAVIERSLDWSVTVGALYLLCDLLEHITEYWYNSSWAMGYNNTLTWMFAKWAELPAWKTSDIEVAAKFRGMVDLITSAFFSDNDYSVFMRLLAVWTNIVCMIIAPLLLFNISFCTVMDEDGECTLRDSISFRFEGNSYHFSIIVMLANVAFVLVYFLIDTLGPTHYTSAVRAWKELEFKFVVEVQAVLNDTPVYRLYHRAQNRIRSMLKLMNETRDKKFTYLLALDSSGRGYEWALTFAQMAIMMGAPVRRAAAVTLPTHLARARASCA